jgi:hypothetical protein
MDRLTRNTKAYSEQDFPFRNDLTHSGMENLFGVGWFGGFEGREGSSPAPRTGEVGTRLAVFTLLAMATRQGLFWSTFRSLDPRAIPNIGSNGPPVLALVALPLWKPASPTSGAGGVFSSSFLLTVCRHGHDPPYESATAVEPFKRQGLYSKERSCFAGNCSAPSPRRGSAFGPLPRLIAIAMTSRFSMRATLPSGSAPLRVSGARTHGSDT